MNYLCLVHFEKGRMDTLSGSELDALVEESQAFDEQLRQAGVLVAADPLLPPESATIVRVRNGRLSITDGPFVETQEQLGGFLLLDVRDLNDALQIAAKVPVARYGTIEVRTIGLARSA
ncbi:YciI family protein [Lysobacter cavernae]|uniref:YciI family protein n=1 Tax=Lysobacter cavernae TaxID=1685901 RepID=A0ABV7RQ48_9GAMM